MKKQVTSKITASLFSVFLSAMISFVAFTTTQAQTTVTGAFSGQVRVKDTPNALADVTVQLINKRDGIPRSRKTNSDGYFFIPNLSPGEYDVKVIASEYETETHTANILVGQTITLNFNANPIHPVTTPSPTNSPQPNTQPSPATQRSVETAPVIPKQIEIIGSFTVINMNSLSLGSQTLSRTFDELAFYLPGVLLPPQSQSTVPGPGVGAGIGTSGQFSVNGIRSRANNFTVDGSDNNDEDIGVRRQGFFTLVPQPIESIQEFQVTTLLAPAQFGRNIGAQVNAVSKQGTSKFHGSVYGLLNARQLNAANFFDTTSGNTTIPLRGRTLAADGVTLTNNERNVFAGVGCFQAGDPGCVQQFVTNRAGSEDAFTLAQGGFTLSGPIVPPRSNNTGVFFFLSGERQVLNATKETNFAVPTVEQRGFGNSGASGISRNPFTGLPEDAFPTTISGDAVFSLFPFPNNPNGVYGRNTFTRELSASARGNILSGRVDGKFRAFSKDHQLTGRYNFTDDFRNVPTVGGALFSSVRPRVQTHNFSTFLNTSLNDYTSNEFRASYGRTRLRFEELRDTEFLIPSGLAAGYGNLAERAFLLNRRTLVNWTLPGDNAVFYNLGTTTVENSISSLNNISNPVGQIIVAGYSPIGTDVFNFPQSRISNTYQLADTVTMQRGQHTIAFGTDLRRTELNSFLPRNSRPLITFNGSLLLNQQNFLFVSPLDLVSAEAPTGVFQSLIRPGEDSRIGLRYYQLNFYGQDQWRIRKNLSLSFGLRYEYNSPPREMNRRIENTFDDILPARVNGLSRFVNGRQDIFDSDTNNFAPRVGLAYSFGANNKSVIRLGGGIFYDQAIGAVVSQSRTAFPTFSTLNFFGFNDPIDGLGMFFPTNAFLNGGDCAGARQVLPGTLNTINPANPFATCFVNAMTNTFPNPFQLTLPVRDLDSPTAYHYMFSFEHQLYNNTFISVGYVGTQGRHLLRLTTPNLGKNGVLVLNDFDVSTFEPRFFGSALNPFNGTAFARPVANAGAVEIYESSANSRYDALQVQFRGRFMQRLTYQFNYTYSRTEDDASDVFDLAGAPALPQNSLTRGGERGRANFDAPHAFSYYVVYDAPKLADENRWYSHLINNWQFTSKGRVQSGQPFTVNSIFDINLDGNLTDRLNSLNGIQVTGSRQRPLTFNGSNTFNSFALLGEDGSIGRNTFRAGNILEFDVSALKTFPIDEKRRIVFRFDVFNITDRANFGIPVRFLEAPGFGRATDTVTPGRRIQFALKFEF